MPSYPVLCHSIRRSSLRCGGRSCSTSSTTFYQGPRSQKSISSRKELEEAVRHADLNSSVPCTGAPLRGSAGGLQSLCVAKGRILLGRRPTAIFYRDPRIKYSSRAQDSNRRGPDPVAIDREKGGVFTLENEVMRVRIDKIRGNIGSIILLATGEDVIAPNFSHDKTGCGLRVFHDHPRKYRAWNIDRNYPKYRVAVSVLQPPVLQVAEGNIPVHCDRICVPPLPNRSPHITPPARPGPARIHYHGPPRP